MSSSIEEYRAHYQATYVPARYSGRLHLICVFVAGIGLIGAIGLWFLGAVTPRDWLALPLTLVIASFVEYWAHRGPMHHPVPGLRALFERHARRHHRYFVQDHMRFRDYRDFHVVLFPPVLIGFFASIAMALGSVVALLTSPAAGAIVAMTSIAYYLAYELLHLSYHTQGLGYTWGLGWLSALARHHQRHHNPALMVHRNFNLVMPLFDVVFRTLDTTPVTTQPTTDKESESDNDAAHDPATAQPLDTHGEPR